MTKLPIPNTSRYVAIDQGTTQSMDPQIVITLHDDDNSSLDRVTIVAERNADELTLIVPEQKDG